VISLQGLALLVIQELTARKRLLGEAIYLGNAKKMGKKLLLIV